MSRISDQLPDGEDFLVRKQRDLERTLQEQSAERSLEASTIGSGGTLKVNGTLEVTGDLVVPAGTLSSATNMTAGVDVVAGRDVTAGRHVTAVSNVTAGGTVSGAAVTASGVVTATGGITSTGVAGFNVTTLPGGRSAVWLHDASGVFGQTTSSIIYKMDLGELPFTADDFIRTSPFVYHYRAQVDIRDNPENAYYDPKYEVPWEVGYMAEHLVENNLGLFVLYDLDGVPKNILYDLFGAVASVVIGRAHAAEIADLQKRIGALEREQSLRA